MTYRMRINGVQVANPAENGIKVVDEPLWADGAGRNVVNGEMIATLIAWKRQVEITWNTLSVNEAKTILNAIKSGGSFFNIEFNDIDSGDTYKTLRVYTSAIPRTLSTLVAISNDNKRRIKDVTIIFTEK